VYGKCLTLLHDENEAQDALQDISLKIFLNIANFNHNSRFTTWVYAICYNYCMDSIRRRRKTRDIFEEGEMEQYKEQEEEVNDSDIVQIEGEYLMKILKLLNPDDRMVLLMKYQDGMLIKEICTVVQKSESAVKMQLKRAKHRVKEHYTHLIKQNPPQL
jgi:RNA polymerase sigma-70 factor (ECF subfamily)